MEYIHYNPITAGLCAYPEDYKYSSAKYYETGEDDQIAIGFDTITDWIALVIIAVLQVILLLLARPLAAK